MLNCFNEVLKNVKRVDGLEKKKKRIMLFPIYMVMFYLLFSIVAYIFCPYEWKTYMPMLFYALLFSYIIAMWFGYRVGIGSNICSSNTWKIEYTERIIKWVGPLLFIHLIIYIISIFRAYALDSFNFVELWNRMIVGLENPGEGYLLFYDLQQGLTGNDVLGGTIFTSIYLIWSLISYPLLIFAFTYFRHLRIYAKIEIISYSVISIVYYISRGTTIQAAHLALFFCIPAILEFLLLWYHGKVTKKNIMKLISIVTLSAMFVVAFFGWMMQSRHAANNSNASEYEIGGYLPGEEVESVVLPEDVPSQPSKLEQFWISFSSYLTQGYYAMSLALTVSWTPTFGLGSSRFVRDMVTKYVFDVSQFTYQTKLEQLGWEDDVRWHSIYTWIANDVSFFGVIIVMFIIAYVFGAMFKDAIVNKNPLAQISIFYWLLLILFIPCNNQIGQSSDLLFSFILICFVWRIQKIEIINKKHLVKK